MTKFHSSEVFDILLCPNGLGNNRGRSRARKTKKEIVFQPNSNTVESLTTETHRDKYNSPSYRGVRLMEVIFNRNHLLGQ